MAGCWRMAPRWSSRCGARGSERQLHSDIETLALVAAGAERLHPAARTANLTGFVGLFAQLVLQELDFRLEALNLVELAAAFEDAGIDYCTLPRPIPGLVTEGVLVMERIAGVPYDTARDAFGENLDGERMLELAIRGVLETTLIYGLFHGDLHAGNVMIERGDTFALVDFGICGRICAEQRAALVQLHARVRADGRPRATRRPRAFRRDPGWNGHRPGPVRLRAASPSSTGSTPRARSCPQLRPGRRGAQRDHANPRRRPFRLPKELVLFFKNLLYLTGFTASVAPDADLLGQVGRVLAHFVSSSATNWPERWPPRNATHGSDASVGAW